MCGNPWSKAWTVSSLPATSLPSRSSFPQSNWIPTTWGMVTYPSPLFYALYCISCAFLAHHHNVLMRCCRYQPPLPADQVKPASALGMSLLHYSSRALFYITAINTYLCTNHCVIHHYVEASCTLLIFHLSIAHIARAAHAVPRTHTRASHACTHRTSPPPHLINPPTVDSSPLLT